jgi:hypothetical protein
MSSLSFKSNFLTHFDIQRARGWNKWRGGVLIASLLNWLFNWLLSMWMAGLSCSSVCNFNLL